MTRTELAVLLGAPAGLVAESRRGPTLIEETDPRKFMSALAGATAGDGDVFLCSPAWGASERAQLKEHLLLTGSSAAPQVSGFRSQVSQPAGLGWLCIPTGGTSGQLKFARHDEETLAAAVHGFARHFGLTQVNAVGVLPLHHVSGLMAWLRCALTGGEYRPLDWKEVEGGQRPVLPPKPGGWVISLVPTQLERLLDGGPVSAPAAVGRETDPPLSQPSPLISQPFPPMPQPELQIEVLKAGTGASPKNGDLVTVHYTGRFTDGSKFDSSVDRDEPFQFALGEGMVIAGWDLGVAKMKIGDKVKLTIPPHLGYGAHGYPGAIPPNATLVFEVELLAIG